MYPHECDLWNSSCYSEIYSVQASSHLDSLSHPDSLFHPDSLSHLSSTSRYVKLPAYFGPMATPDQGGHIQDPQIQNFHQQRNHLALAEDAKMLQPHTDPTPHPFYILPTQDIPLLSFNELESTGCTI
jgi:hypothetical protein